MLHLRFELLQNIVKFGCSDAVVWLEYCRYGVKHYPINQSIYYSAAL